MPVKGNGAGEANCTPTEVLSKVLPVGARPVMLTLGIVGGAIVELHENCAGVEPVLSLKLTVNENAPDVDGVPILGKRRGRTCGGADS